MEKLSFKVAEYDAPLDLILHLISKHKLDIMDIDISALLEQYLAFIQGWREQNLEVQSEFLEMASRIVYMKSVSLLPRHEEAQQLQAELTGQLVEYRLCKLTAELMRGLYRGGDIYVRRPTEIPIDLTYRLTHSPRMLYNALQDAQGKGARRLPPPRDSFEPLVSRPVVSVTAKLFSVLRDLRRHGRLQLDKLYRPEQGRSSVIATFLAVLELVKSSKVTISPKNEVTLIKKHRKSA